MKATSQCLFECKTTYIQVNQKQAFRQSLREAFTSGAHAYNAGHCMPASVPTRNLNNALILKGLGKAAPHPSLVAAYLSTASTAGVVTRPFLYNICAPHGRMKGARLNG